MSKVIITCAVTGAIHTPTMSDALPLTPDQIVEESVAAAEAGAAILHLHARDPKDGSPTPDPAVFMQFLPRIKQRCEAVINITTGGGQSMSLEERLAAPLAASPEMCSLNMGSMNFALHPLAERYDQWKYEWEKPYLEASRDVIFRNTFGDIERIQRLLGEGHGMRFEFECYDVGHLYNLAIAWSRAGYSRRCSCSSCSAFWAASGPIRRPCLHCCGPRTGCSAPTSNGRCWRPAATRCRSPPTRRCWAAMCASGSKTACSWGAASWPQQCRAGGENPHHP